MDSKEVVLKVSKLLGFVGLVLMILWAMELAAKFVINRFIAFILVQLISFYLLMAYRYWEKAEPGYNNSAPCGLDQYGPHSRPNVPPEPTLESNYVGAEYPDYGRGSESTMYAGPDDCKSFSGTSMSTFSRPHQKSQLGGTKNSLPTMVSEDVTLEYPGNGGSESGVDTDRYTCQINDEASTSSPRCSVTREDDESVVGAMDSKEEEGGTGCQETMSSDWLNQLNDEEFKDFCDAFITMRGDRTKILGRIKKRLNVSGASGFTPTWRRMQRRRQHFKSRLEGVRTSSSFASSTTSNVSNRRQRSPAGAAQSVNKANTGHQPTPET